VVQVAVNSCEMLSHLDYNRGNQKRAQESYILSQNSLI